MLKRLWDMPDSERDLWESRFWIIITPAIVIWWRDSVFVVILVSLYANYKTAHGSYEAAKAKEALEAKEE